MLAKPLPPLDELQGLFAYDPETGALTWKVSKGRVKVGTEARSLNCEGYFRVGVNRAYHMVHRICWALHYGQDPGNSTIDHINGVKSDNRIGNLRLASMSEQCFNQRLKSTNTSGYRGVRFDTYCNKWRVRIKVNYKYIHLGLFDNIEDAIAARLQGEKAHGIETPI